MNAHDVVACTKDIKVFLLLLWMLLRNTTDFEDYIIFSKSTKKKKFNSMG